MHNGKLFFFIIPILALVSCSSEHSKIVVAEYGNYKIYMDEFEKAYSKNAGGVEKASKDSLDAYKNFLALYVNYKLKLRDAAVRGYTKDADMQKEYNDYKKNIGATLFLENELYEPNLKQLYERRKTEYRASHIFLTPDDSTDQKKIEELGNQILEHAKNGEDFASLAKQYSKDSYTNRDGGDVYYFTAGQINSAVIEDAVYSLNEGEIYPSLVNSGFGYHIIKITEKHPRRVSLRAEHILIQFKDSTGAADTAKALKEITEIERQLKNGADFNDLAFKYSQDSGSRLKKGDLGFLRRRDTFVEFDEALFKLKIGEISPIVKTRFGFHIIKVVDESLYPSYEQEKEELKEIFQHSRYKTEFEKIVERLKKEFHYHLNEDTFNKVLSMADTLKISSDYWGSKLNKEAGNSNLFTINGSQYFLDSLVSNMIKLESFAGKTFDLKTLKEGIEKYAGDLLVKQKAIVYDKVDPEFAKLMEDYENGMYLFKVLDDEIWSKLEIDSAKVQKFYDETKVNYRWKDRVEFKEIYSQSDSLINNCYSLAVSGYDFDSLFVKFSQRIGYENKPGYYGLIDTDFNELAKQSNTLEQIGDISKPFQFEGGWSIVKLIKREPARLKTFDEAKGEAASILQEKESKRLDEVYLNKLKKIYKPKLHYDKLHNAFKQQ